MSKLKVKLITIGHMPPHLNLQRVQAWRSELFELSGAIENFTLNGNSDGEGWEFSDASVRAQLPDRAQADFLLAIVNVPLEQNWYARRVAENQVVFTFHQIREFLSQEGIPLENAIFYALYQYSLLYKRTKNRIPSIHEPVDFTHDETRGCVFDMHGIKMDIVESCNRPVICADCEARLKRESVSTNIIRVVQNELLRIRKPLYYRALDFVRERPLTSLFISSLYAVLLGVAGSLLASFLHDRLS